MSRPKKAPGPSPCPVVDMLRDTLAQAKVNGTRESTEAFVELSLLDTRRLVAYVGELEAAKGK